MKIRYKPPLGEMDLEWRVDEAGLQRIAILVGIEQTTAETVELTALEELIMNTLEENKWIEQELGSGRS